MPKKNRNNDPARMDRCLRMRRGIIASSPRFHCTKPNRAARIPNPTNKPITFDDLHGSVCPPHCNARIKQHIATKNIMVPTISRRANLALRGRFRSSLLVPLIRRKIITRIIAKPPIGALLWLLSMTSLSYVEGPRRISTSRKSTANSGDR